VSWSSMVMEIGTPNTGEALLSVMSLCDNLRVLVVPMLNARRLSPCGRSRFATQGNADHAPAGRRQVPRSSSSAKPALTAFAETVLAGLVRDLSKSSFIVAWNSSQSQSRMYLRPPTRTESSLWPRTPRVIHRQTVAAATPSRRASLLIEWRPDRPRCVVLPDM